MLACPPGYIRVVTTWPRNSPKVTPGFPLVAYDLGDRGSGGVRLIHHAVPRSCGFLRRMLDCATGVGGWEGLSRAVAAVFPGAPMHRLALMYEADPPAFLTLWTDLYRVHQERERLARLQGRTRHRMRAASP